MPQFRNSESCQGYVNPAHLYSTFPIVYDHDVTVPQPYDAYVDIEAGASVNYFYQGNIFDPKSFQGQTDKSSALPMTPKWPTDNGTELSNVRDDCSGSSASNSPSPDNTSSQPGQSHKRRAQNRAAQRAYRDRKVRYLLDLQSGIQDIEQKISRLQTENTELIRELCEMRAANNDLRDSNRGNHPQLVNRNNVNASEASGQDGPSEAWSTVNCPTTGELDALYEPFAAMWNLIHLDPSVVRGTVSAQTVLERLRAMVEFSATKPNMRSPRSYSTSDIPEWPGKT